MPGATLSILGLYNYQPTIFDALIIPPSVDRQTLIDNIIMGGAELEVVYPHPDLLSRLIGAWSRSRLAAWERMIAALDAEYSPIENTDRFETVTESYTRNLTESGERNSNSNTSGSGSNTLSIKKSSYNAGMELTEEDATDSSDTSENTQSANDSRMMGGSDERSIERHAHGNIGVTTNQQMIEAEVTLRRYDIYNIITNEFLNKFCIGVY